MYIILVYDICLIEKTKGQKVLRQVFKKCKQYLNHVQNSVFEGELTDAGFEELKYDLKNIIRDEEDSILFFKSGNQKWLDKESLGKEKNICLNIL